MVIIERAAISDANNILVLQKLAYQSEATIYNDFTIQPLHQTLEEIETEFQHQVFLKALAENKIIGSVRAYKKDGTCFIGKLIVHPEHQNQSIGTRLMSKIEHHFYDALRFELFTGLRSERNLYLYQKLGYKIIREKKVTDFLTLAFLQKERN